MPCEVSISLFGLGFFINLKLGLTFSDFPRRSVLFVYKMPCEALLHFFSPPPNTLSPMFSPPFLIVSVFQVMAFFPP